MPGNPLPLELSVGVLAGGLSARMGTDKALLDFGGRPLVAHVAARLAGVSDDVFVVAKKPLGELGVAVVPDEHGAQTPLAGIATALRFARHPWVFVCACDMPLVSPELVGLLARFTEGADVVCPVRGGHPEPLSCLWSIEAGPAVESAIAAGDYAVREVIDSLRCRGVSEEEWRAADPEGVSFTNVNSPGDMAAALSMLSPRR